jgi:uncharacterized protein YukE
MLNIDTNVLDHVSKSLKSISEDLATQYNTMNNIMDDVQVAWQSDYTYKYLDATKEVQGDIKSVSSDIYRLGDTINEISQQLKQTESDLSNRFSKM